MFKDPSAPPAEWYEAFYLGSISQEQLAEYRRMWPDDVDAFQPKRQHVPALFGGISPDGLHWTPLPEPLLVQTSDTHNICAYDLNLGRYVAYVRTWHLGRRTIGRTETEDFRHFPLPEEVFWPDAMGAPYDLWYVNAKTLMPGTTDYHLMFPMRWSLIDDLGGKTIIRNYLGDYQKGEEELPFEELLHRLHNNRSKIRANLGDPAFQHRLRQEYQASLEVLLPIKRRLNETDALIDQIVYKLYGLTDEEIAIVLEIEA